MTPNSSIHLMSGCPLDNTYEHTIYFSNAGSQNTYFVGLIKHTLTNQQYARASKTSIKVGLPIAKVFDCNYMRFVNTGYENKYFYAFITSVEYVNENTTLLTYEIDVMQTWAFAYTLKQCFVEREHTANDSVGANTVPEDLETGDYITTRTEQIGDGSLDVYLMASGLPKVIYDQLSPIERIISYPATLNGLPNTAWILHYDPNETGVFYDIGKAVVAFNNDTEGNEIIGIFCAPSGLVGYTDVLNLTHTGLSNFVSKRADGGTIKNNKLRTYPYCSITANANGQSMEYKPELFNGSPQFKTYGTLSPNSSVFLFPVNYGGVSEDYNHGVTLKGFPMLPWKNDGYQQYMAEHSHTIETSQSIAESNMMITGIAELGRMAQSMGASTFTGLKSMNTAGNEWASTMAKIRDLKALPDSLQGVASSLDNLSCAKKNTFYLYYNSLKPEFISIIDDYFTRYGYATHKIKVPNKNVRKRWCYTKTRGCLLTGSIPYEYRKAIAQIYDKGITFWKNASDIGNYSLDNPTV